jgi:succinyl-CoA synthetase beta subunit
MGKELFCKFNIPVPEGKVFHNPEFVEEYVTNLGEVVIKSQVLSGGRGKAGGVKFATNGAEAKMAVDELLQTKIKGFPVHTVLVEKKLTIDQEIYLAITVDGAAKKPVVIASACGGVDIETVAEDNIVKRYIDVHQGVQPYIGREIAFKLGLNDMYFKQFVNLLVKMYNLFRSYDCELVEINPLVISKDQLIAADAKVNVDDEAVFRYQPGLPIVDDRSDREKKAHEIGISYVELDGDIAVMANGAGITMATLDILHHYGGKPRNFMDAGGGANTEATAKALEILLSTKPKAILANIFGGITRCNDVANAFKHVSEQLGIPVPVVIRLVGTNEEEGIEILKQQGIDSFRTVHEAVAKVVELATASEGGAN